MNFSRILIFPMSSNANQFKLTWHSTNKIIKFYLKIHEFCIDFYYSGKIKKQHSNLIELYDYV